MGKVFKNGNSLAVTVPKAYAHQLSIKAGSKFEWEKTDKGITLVAENRTRKPSDVNPEVARLIGKISKKYKQVWADLAKV